MSVARRQLTRPVDHSSAGDGTGAAGFDFTGHMRQLCADMVARLDALRHIEMARVAVSFSQTRKTGRYGMYASLTPLRFSGGQTETIRRGRRWGLQRLVGADGREMLYILNFYLPRFLDLPLEEKLSTTVHELWHIGPRFDGDLRRHGGRCFAHSPSQKRYDAYVGRLVDRWLSLSPPEPVYGFLRLSFQQLAARYGHVWGRRTPAPRLIPLE